MNIYCCQCEKDVDARLTSGKEIYPHRNDLASIPFWKCDACGNNVGCHHKTKTPTKPLGVIASPAIKNARQHLHRIIDPLWQSGLMKRKEVYRMISDRLGWEYHTAEIRTIDQARDAYRAAISLQSKN